MTYGGLLWSFGTLFSFLQHTTRVEIELKGEYQHIVHQVARGTTLKVQCVIFREYLFKEYGRD